MANTRLIIFLVAFIILFNSILAYVGVAASNYTPPDSDSTIFNIFDMLKVTYSDMPYIVALFLLIVDIAVVLVIYILVRSG